MAHGDLELDPMKHECRYRGQPVFLTATAFLLLRSLLAFAQKVYSRSERVERAYGFGHRITERTVDRHVRRIRKKFESLGVDPIEIAVRDAGPGISPAARLESFADARRVL